MVAITYLAAAVLPLLASALNVTYPALPVAKKGQPLPQVPEPSWPAGSKQTVTWTHSSDDPEKLAIYVVQFHYYPPRYEKVRTVFSSAEKAEITVPTDLGRGKGFQLHFDIPDNVYIPKAISGNFTILPPVGPVPPSNSTSNGTFTTVITRGVTIYSTIPCATGTAYPILPSNPQNGTRNGTVIPHSAAAALSDSRVAGLMLVLVSIIFIAF